MKRRADSSTDGFRLPARPTKSLPGTAAKLRILRRRAARGERLFHPDDAQMDQAKLARVPVISRGNFKIIGWEIVEERDWRAHQPIEENWLDDED